MRANWTVGGLSPWTILAVASVLLVFPTGLSLLFSPSTSVQNGQLYATETFQWYSLLRGGPYGLCAHLGVPVILLHGVGFSGGVTGNFISGRGCGNWTFFGSISESSGEKYEFNLPVNSTSEWATPDGVAAMRVNGPFPSTEDSITIFVQILSFPGAPLLVGQAMFGFGVIGLLSYVAFLVVHRWRSRRSAETPSGTRDSQRTPPDLKHRGGR